MHVDSLGRGGRAPDGLGFAREGFEGLFHCCGRRRGSVDESYRGAFRVSVEDGNTVAGCGDADGVRGVQVERGVRGVDRAEDLGELPFHLLFLPTDQGDDIVEDVEGGDAWVTCAGDGLHRRDHD